MSRVPEQNRPGNGHAKEATAIQPHVVPGRADIPAPPESFGRGEPPKEEAGKEKEKESGDQKPYEKKKPPLYRRPMFWAVTGVVVIGLTIGGILWYLSSRGKVSTDDAFIAAHVTNVAPRVAGHVLKVLVTDNQDVKAGDLLVELDPVDLQQSLESAEAQMSSAQSQVRQSQAQVVVAKAQVAQAEADIAAAQANATQADEDLKRYQAADRRAVSEQQVDAALAAARSTHATLESARQKKAAAEAQITLAEAQVATANDQVRRAKTAAEQANTQLTYTKIAADQDGRINNLSVSVGDWEQAGGQALMAIVPTSQVYVIANLKETELKDIHPGQRAEIRVDAYGIRIKGTVDSIQSASGSAFSLLPAENATGNYVKIVQRIPVKIRLDPAATENRKYLLGPGMSVVPTIFTRDKDDER